MTVEDLAYYDKEIFYSMQYIRDNNISDASGLNFTI